MTNPPVRYRDASSEGPNRPDRIGVDVHSLGLASTDSVVSPWYHWVMAMTLRLSDDEALALRHTADQEGRSMQEVARDAISRYTSGRERLRDEALGRIDTEWRDVFDRLAET